MVDQKILSSERSLEKNKSIKTALALTARYFIRGTLKYRDSPTAPNEVGYVKKAYQLALKALNDNPSSVDIFLTVIFLRIEVEAYDSAEEMLKIILPYRNYYRNNSPVHYGYMNFLSALLDTRLKHARPAKKSFRLIEDCAAEVSDHRLQLLLGIISYELFQYDEAYEYFLTSYKKGCRSAFLFLYLYKFYEEAPKKVAKANAGLLSPLAKWGVAQGADLSRILDVYRDDVIIYDRRVYELYNYEWILIDICKALIRANDYSAEAFYYYKEAEARQIPLDGLFAVIIKAAFINGAERISRYSMEEFLRGGELDLQLKAFVYHTLLTNDSMSELLETAATQILQFGVYCLENDLRGRYYNSIYKFFLQRLEGRDIPGTYIAKCERFLLDDLFTYEIKSQNPLVKYVFVGEKEKKDMMLYELLDGSAKIKASKDSFYYVCLTANKRSLIDDKLQVTKCIENEDAFLYSYFFRRGIKSFELLTLLTKRCLTYEKQENDFMDIYEGVLAFPEISKSFKMQVKSELAYLLYANGQFAEALEHYKAVDESYLSDRHIERMLCVFIDSGEHESAVRLIIKKSERVSEAVLLHAVKLLSQTERYRPVVANAAYELLLKSFYDKSLVDIVINYYNGSQEEWLKLDMQLASMNIFEPRLDRVILENSIWLRKPDTDAQRVFVRMYNNEFDSELTDRFVYYLIYEIIINAFRPEYETIVALEKIFTDAVTDSTAANSAPDDNIKLLAYALCHIYYDNKISTFNSDRILSDAIKFMENDDVIFPIFKKNRDISGTTPYLEKNQPFLYRSLPDKNIWLCYKTEDDADYFKKKMKYVRFGLYIANIKHFYGEQIDYYFCEESPTGSVNTKESSVSNSALYINEDDADPYFVINNALIYEHMFKYEQVEGIITGMLKEPRAINGALL